MVAFLGWPECLQMAILALCLLSIYSENILEFGGFYKKDVRELRHVRREMQSAIANVSLAELRQLLTTNVTESICETLNNERQNPYYMLTQMKEDVTAEAELIMLLVFHFFSKLNGDGSYYYHPLTSAYRNHRYRLAERILTRLESDAFSEVVKEVYASMLSCETIAHVDTSVTLIIDETETRDCVLHYASKKSYNQSELQSVYMDRYPGKRQRKPSHWVLWVLSFWEPQRIIAPPSTLRSKMWFSPFAPIYSFEILPPRHLIVMNPSVFHDFVDATWYYFVGSILPINAITTHAIILVSIISLLVLLWSKHVIQCFMPDITTWVNNVFLHYTIDNTDGEQIDTSNANEPTPAPISVANAVADANDDISNNDNDNSMDNYHDIDEDGNHQYCHTRRHIDACEQVCERTYIGKM